MSDPNLPAIPKPIIPEVAPYEPERFGLIGAWLAGRPPSTVQAYTKDLRHFARWQGSGDADGVVRLFLHQPQGTANAILDAYKATQSVQGVASATIARRLATIRSLVAKARSYGLVAWTVDVQAPRVETYRDTRGPSTQVLRELRELLERRHRLGSIQALRDLALYRLMADRGLRVGEALGIDLEQLELDQAEPRVWITGKGRTAPEPLTLGLPTVRAIRDWLTVRGELAKPWAFPAYDNRTGVLAGGRLTVRAVEYGLAAYSRRLGLTRPITPHQLRHYAITRALDVRQGNVREVQRFSRHAKVETVLKYDDARTDVAGSITRVLGEDW